MQALDAFSREQLQAAPPHRSWSPGTLLELSERVHDTVERGGALGPAAFASPRLDAGAQAQLWRESVHIDATAIRVPMRPENSELAVLAGVTGMFLGGMGIAVSGPVVLLLVAQLSNAAQLAPTATSAMSLQALIHPALLLGLPFAVLGFLILLLGGLLTARAIQQHELRIGQHAVEYDGTRMPYDIILAVHADQTQLHFDLLDGSRVTTPPDMLDPSLATSLAKQIRTLLPEEPDRAAGFVAYERARATFDRVVS
jgi:hypothetical protein